MCFPLFLSTADTHGAHDRPHRKGDTHEWLTGRVSKLSPVLSRQPSPGSCFPASPGAHTEEVCPWMWEKPPPEQNQERPVSPLCESQLGEQGNPAQRSETWVLFLTLSLRCLKAWGDSFLTFFGLQPQFLERQLPRLSG